MLESARTLGPWELPGALGISWCQNEHGTKIHRSLLGAWDHGNQQGSLQPAGIGLSWGSGFVGTHKQLPKATGVGLVLGPAGTGVHCETGHSFYSPSPTGKVSLSVLVCPGWGEGNGGNVILPFLPSSKCLFYFHAALRCYNLSPGILALLKIIFRYFFCAQMFVQMDVLGAGTALEIPLLLFC